MGLEDVTVTVETSDLVKIVENLALAVSDVGRSVEHLRQVAEIQQGRLDATEERHAAGLEGIGKLGKKVGALATAMDRSLKHVNESRDRLTQHQERINAEYQAAVGRAERGPSAKNNGP